MSDRDAPPPPAGWYLNADGRNQWWTGSEWDDKFQNPPPLPTEADSTLIGRDDVAAVKPQPDSSKIEIGTGSKGSKSRPLTGSYPIDVAAFDAGGAKYSTIDGLDQIAGNPGCNEEVQPGQLFKESFIFLMLADAKPDQLVWASVDSDGNQADSAGIDISKN